MNIEHPTLNVEHSSQRDIGWRSHSLSGVAQKPILLVNDGMDGGGAERSMAILANALAGTNRFRISLLSLENRWGYDLEESIQRFSFHEQYKWGEGQKFATMLSDGLRLKRLIARTGAETVLSFCYRSSFINAIAKLLGAGHKCIVSERNYPSEYFSKGLRAAVVKSLIRTLYNRADIVTCNGSETKESLERDFSVRCPIHVIPNAYNREEILARSQEAIDSKDEHIFKRGKRIIIYVSRMAANKGHKDLVEAFCKLRNRSAYTLVLVGDGPCEAQLRGQVERMSLGNEVFLIGRRNNPFPYLARAEIFVMPSYYEGYPNALAEALICGLACIAYDFKAGARELLGDNEAGLLVRRGDIAELAQAIETVENRSHRARLFTTAQLCEAYGKIL